MSATNVAAITHRTELAADGYEQIEAKIQEIENLAYNGVFSTGSVTSRFQEIGSAAKQLRLILRDVLLIVPTEEGAAGGKGDAA